VAILLLAVSVQAATPTHQWSQRFGDTSFDSGEAVALDASGNVIAVGYFEGTVNFGGGGLVSAGSADIVVAKYDANGVHQWSKRFGDTLCDEGYGVAVDASGNVIVVGHFEGNVNFGGGNLVSSGDYDIFVAKFDANGVHQWSKRFGNVLRDRGWGVAVDASSNVVVTGSFRDVVNFGGGNLTSAGANDTYIAKFDQNGVHQWSQRFGSTVQDEGYEVAVDASGNVMITGYFYGTANFGGGNLVSVGINDIFVAKYNANGLHQWSKRFGDTSFDNGEAVASDASGNVLVTGHFGNTVNFGGGNLVSAGSRDIFVAKYDANGVHQWSQRFGSTSGDFGYSAVTDASGNVFVSGCFAGTVSFGGGNLVSAGSDDIFVAKYSANGVHQWSQRFGDIESDCGYAVGVDALGGVTVTGYFAGTVDFGGGNLVSAGSDDIFLVKYSESTVAAETMAPMSVALSQNIPNPFHPQTTLSFTLPRHSHVRLSIYNVAGRLVRTLVDDERAAGRYAVVWEGLDDRGRSVASGSYLYRMEAGEFVETRRMVLLK
jgi:hypothetical protein